MAGFVVIAAATRMKLAGGSVLTPPGS